VQEPSNISQVRLLDPNYQTVANGTLSLVIDNNAEPNAEPNTAPKDVAVSAVLNLSGSFNINDLKMTGSANFYVLGSAAGMMMGQSFMLSGQDGDTPYYLLLTSWGDSTDVLGYFFGDEGFGPDKRHLITT
jgi:hypothetical protein